MAASAEEHRISIPYHNNTAGGSGASVGPPEINEEDTSSLPSDPPNSDEPNSDDEEWIRKMVYKMKHALANLIVLPTYSEDEAEDKIRVPTALQKRRISQRRPETEERLSPPSVVGIGPFHYRDSLSISKKKKWAIVGLTKFLYGLNLRSCLVRIKNQVANARGRYNLDEVARSFSVDENIWAEMLLLDSYFILFTLTIKLLKGPTDYILMPLTPKLTLPLTLHDDGRSKFLDIIFNEEETALDLLKVDNQIPIFVIEELFEELKSDKPLHEYALDFFETIHPRSARHCKDQNISSPPKFLHLLHLFHWSRVPQNKYFLSKQLDSIDYTPNEMERRESAIEIEKEKLQQLDSIYYSAGCYTPNAMELRESAIVFEKKPLGSSLDITFRRRLFNRIIGVLDIPELHIRTYSSLIFHNLIAFEIQSSSRVRSTVAFSALMHNFLQSEEDVKLLRRRGILASSFMTDRELIDLFARLSKLTENHQMPSDLFNICHHVKSYHNHPVSRFCGSVILQYFPNPLVTLSVFGATMIFILTLLQTIYAMRYHN